MYLIFNEDGTYQGKSRSKHESPDRRTTVEISEKEASNILENADVEYLPEIGITPNIAALQPFDYAEYFEYTNGEVQFNYNYSKPIWPEVSFTDIKFWYDEEHDCPVLYSVEPEFVYILTVSVVSYPDRYSPDWVSENPEEVVQSILNDILIHEDVDLTVGASLPEYIQLIIGDRVGYMSNDEEASRRWRESRISSEFAAYELEEIGDGHAYMWRY